MLLVLVVSHRPVNRTKEEKDFLRPEKGRRVDWMQWLCMTDCWLRLSLLSVCCLPVAPLLVMNVYPDPDSRVKWLTLFESGMFDAGPAVHPLITSRSRVSLLLTFRSCHTLCGILIHLEKCSSRSWDVSRRPHHLQTVSAMCAVWVPLLLLDVTHILTSFPFQMNAGRSCLLKVKQGSVLTTSRRPIVHWIEALIKWHRELVTQPLRVIYRKDSRVSRARNILVYKARHHISAPILGFVVNVAFGIICVHCYYSYKYCQSPEYDPLEKVEQNAVFSIVGISVYAFFVHRFLGRYIIRMYYNEPKQQFTLVTFRWWAPWLTNNRIVKAGSAKLLKKYMKDPHTGRDVDFRITANCDIGGKYYYLSPNHFKFPVYYNVLFGYDDPQAISKLHDDNTNADQIFKERAEERFEWSNHLVGNKLSADA